MVDRRKFLKSTGVVAAAASVAGCLGRGERGSADESDQTVREESPGFFDFDTNVYEERMGEEVKVTQLAVFRTARNVGIRFVVANEAGGVLTSLTAHAQILDENNSVISTFEIAMESESIDDLATDEKWHGDMVFEDIDASQFDEDVAAVRFWVTAQAEPK